MRRSRERLIRALMTLATGGVALGSSGCGSGDEVYGTIGSVFRIVDIWV